MKAVVRVDSSVQMGSGHVMRCLTLSHELRRHGAEVIFICRLLPGNLCGQIREAGFEVWTLPAPSPDDLNQTLPADRSSWLGVPWGTDVRDTLDIIAAFESVPEWLIVDNYCLDVGWEKLMRPHVGRIMVIDDLADRPHDCDAILDQNLVDSLQNRYDDLTPPGCVKFLGPRFVLLRDEFIAARKTLPERRGEVDRILVFFGGSDPTNETEKSIAALAELARPDISVDVVVGSGNVRAAQLREACSRLPNVHFHHQVTNMASLMAAADLAIGAGGTTTWERCYLGVPALIVVVAENQVQPARAVDAAGVAKLLGSSGIVSSTDLAAALRQILREPAKITAMAEKCLSFLGERANPVHDEILSLLCEDR